MFWVCGFAAALVARAADSSADIIPLGVAGWREQAREGVAAAGRPVSFELLIPAALDPATLQVDLRQVTGAVTLPLGRHALAEWVVASATPASPLTTVRIPLPELARTALVQLRVFGQAEPGRSLCTINLRVYVPTDWNPLAAHLGRTGTDLVVVGRETGLREFLKTRNIPFTDGGESIPANLRPDTLVVGVFSKQEWMECLPRLGTTSGRLIGMVTDTDLPPGVYTTTSEACSVTKITLPLLKTLSQDPRNEALFLQLIEQHLTSASTLKS